MDWQSAIEAIYSDMVKWRRHLHQYPEPSFQETKTSQWIVEQLQRIGIEAKKGKHGHQVTATIVGGKPGPTVALRADMDALEIQDQKTVPYASKVDGVMHACGHDGHMAVLLATAKILWDHRQKLAGNVRLLFQHAEEICPGGALTVIDEGGLEDVDVIYGIHLWTPLSLGSMATRAGAFMASADEFRIEVKGKGGHGGLPHEAVDSVVIGSHLVVNLQSIVSRTVDPVESCVVSVGSLNAGDSFNAIAETCRMKGTVRTFSEPLREHVSKQIERIAHHTAAMYGAEAKVDYEWGYPPLINDRTEAERVLEVGARLFGDNNVRSDTLVMAAEDFAYYVQKVPGCYLFVGAGRGDDAVPHHHPAFDIDERAMKHAVAMFLSLVDSYMSEKSF